MKKILTALVLILIVAFLAITNPTVEEYAAWYAEQSNPQQDSFLDELLASYAEYMAENATRTSFLVGSVFEYDGHKTLGVAMLFFPLDTVDSYVQDFREGYADWLENR